MHGKIFSENNIQEMDHINSELTTDSTVYSPLSSLLTHIVCILDMLTSCWVSPSWSATSS